MMNWELINKEFEDIKDVLFFNICSTAVPPKSVQKAYMDFIEKGILNYNRTIIPDGRVLLGEAKETVGRLINANASEIAFVKNTTEAMGIIANGYDFKKGDNIIVCDEDFSSTIYAFINLQKKGVELKRIKTTDGSILLEHIEEAIDENTKAVVISAVQFTSGYYIDMYKLGELCKKNNVLFIVDGIQAVGRLNVDVKKMNISFMAVGGYKGLLSSFGVGFLYCDSELAPQIEPIAANHFSAENSFDTPVIEHDFSKMHWYEDSRRFEAGHLNYPGIAGVKKACELIETLGINEIEEHILNLQSKVVDGLSKLNYDFITPSNKENYSGILSVYYNVENEEKVKEIMSKYNVICTLKNGYIRLGIGFYNTEDHIDKVLKAFEEIKKI